MKKVVNFLTVAGFMFFGAIQSTFAQGAVTEERTFHQELKQRFIEGDPTIYGNCISRLNFRFGHCN